MKMMIMPALKHQLALSSPRCILALTCMMNVVMGFLGSYCVGLTPSRIPPCGEARSLLAVVEVDAIVVVTKSVTVVVIVAIIAFC